MIYVIGAIAIAFFGLLTLCGFEYERANLADKRADAATLQLKAAQEEAEAWHTRWSAQVDYADAQKRNDDAMREQAFKELEARAKVGGKCVAPHDISSLLADIARSANAARIAGVDQSSGDAVSRSAKKP